MIHVLAALVLAHSSASAFETCTPKNDYFERLLPKPSVQVNTDVSMACVEAAQRGLPAKGMYGFCAGDKGKIKRTHPRACLSEAYVGAVHAALADVTECLGFDAQLAFATFNLESGAHVNAVGAAGDAGVGQLTKPAIEQVNRQEFDRAKAMVTKSNSAACRKILPRMIKATSDVQHRCAFITVPANPVRNVIYSVLLIQNNRRMIDLFWNRLKPKLPAGIDVVRLKERLTMLAYNSGAAGAVAVTAGFIRQAGAKLTERELHFENTGPRGLVPYMAKHFPVKGARRRRIAGYVPGVIAAARRTEARAGESCFEPQLFPALARAVAPDADDAAGPSDDADADRIVDEQLLTLAEDFVPAGPRAFDCGDAREQFREAFLPPGASEDEMPDSLRPAYAKLCDQ